MPSSSSITRTVGGRKNLSKGSVAIALREPVREGRAAERAGADVDAALVLPGDGAAEPEPEARALAGRTGGDERLEQVRLQFRGHAAAVIVHAHRLAWAQARVLRRP